jgi:hypothetical protein
MTEALASKTCTPCRGGIPPLTREQAELFHGQAPGWQLVEEAHRIERSLGHSLSSLPGCRSARKEPPGCRWLFHCPGAATEPHCRGRYLGPMSHLAEGNPG